MPLIAERSIIGWAKKLAAERNELFSEVLFALARAVIGNELRVFHSCSLGVFDEIDVYKLPPIIRDLSAVLCWPYFGQALGNDWLNEHLTNLDNDLMIATEDMDRWLKAREAAVIDEPKPGVAPDLHTAIEEVSLTLGERGRGCPCGTFDKAVWNRLGVALDKGRPPRNFGSKTIERIVKDRRSDKSDKFVGNVVSFVGNVGMTGRDM
jgi:hypothetical protein